MTTTQQAHGTAAGMARRMSVGAASGAVATMVMSWLMLAGVATGASPMPKPIPVALAAQQFGDLAMPRLFALGMLAHFGYGAAAGAIFGLAGRWANWRGGLAYGGVLWLVLGLVWLPYLGWGPFGTGADGAIAVATLVLHLLYGVTLGLLLGRFPGQVAATAAGT